jgi:hypothetical protein
LLAATLYQEKTAWVAQWAASDKAYQLLAHGRWFSPGTPASSTTKTGRHDIAEILLKVALYTKNQSKCIQKIPDCNHKLCNIESTEKYVLLMQGLLECCYIHV